MYGKFVLAGGSVWMRPFTGSVYATRDSRIGRIGRIDRISRRKKTGFGGTLKVLYANDLELSFQKNLSGKTRFWVIVVRKLPAAYKIFVPFRGVRG
jgi:hypothetical protein